MGSGLSSLQQKYCQDLKHLLQKNGHAVSINEIEQLVKAIYDFCPWVPENGTLKLQVWEKIGTQFQNHPRVSVTVQLLWCKVRICLQNITPKNILLAQGVTVSLPQILPPCPLQRPDLKRDSDPTAPPPYATPPDPPDLNNKQPKNIFLAQSLTTSMPQILPPATGDPLSPTAPPPYGPQLPPKPPDEGGTFYPALQQSSTVTPFSAVLTAAVLDLEAATTFPIISRASIVANALALPATSSQIEAITACRMAGREGSEGSTEDLGSSLKCPPSRKVEKRTKQEKPSDKLDSSLGGRNWKDEPEGESRKPKIRKGSSRKFNMTVFHLVKIQILQLKEAQRKRGMDPSSMDGRFLPKYKVGEDILQFLAKLLANSGEAVLLGSTFSTC